MTGEDEFWFGEKIQVVSSNIAWAQWSEAEHLLTLGFHDESVYSYFPVNARLADSFLKAPSKGKWRHANFPRGHSGVTCLARKGRKMPRAWKSRKSRQPKWIRNLGRK